ncbi:Uncharacterised protein [Mycobacteroides abscessus subsp. massiliense]|nr:Uncharacterised protein [Mycobacteroides abscessus subsp. massiliense]SKH92306.1 Uncharacterised protein [Mycobacteroides abscessus subsp. massiliense]SKI12665.1 Uncharacterised protein [Mycobacteroides abscessus subsp. massiliense]SKK21147.1 Uncharacterised protein [Mycobacteroides abscessus subsp. massiliense]SKK32030.1 Uncharacterised protein [Mycobacteroides abscessus subsp. massiliense]
MHRRPAAYRRMVVPVNFENLPLLGYLITTALLTVSLFE